MGEEQGVEGNRWTDRYKIWEIYSTIDNKIIVEIKAVSFMPKDYETQLTYYLKGTNYKLGFLINFGSKKLNIKRRVWTPNYQRQSASA